MKHLLPTLFLFQLSVLCFPAMIYGQRVKNDRKLEGKLEQAIKGFHGVAGIYVKHLKSGREAGINADSIFPTASIVKVPILVGIFDQIEQGKLSYHQPMIYREAIRYGGSGLMQNFKDSTSTELSVLISLMMSYSDNTASLWNQELAGGGLRINELMDQYGFKDIRVNSRTKGREDIWKVFGWGQTSPRAMANLLVRIRKGEIVSPAASEKMYRIMTKGYYDENALSQIPAYVHAAAKAGAVDRSRSEVVLVNAPHGDYVFYAGTKDNEDQSWTKDNEAEQLIRNISALLWNYFES